MRSNTPYEYLNKEGEIEEVYSPSNSPEGLLSEKITHTSPDFSFGSGMRKMFLIGVQIFSRYNAQIGNMTILALMSRGTTGSTTVKIVDYVFTSSNTLTINMLNIRSVGSNTLTIDYDISDATTAGSASLRNIVVQELTV